MKAVQFVAYGGPEVLQVVQVEEPHAGSGQVRIAVRAAGVNGIDWKIRAGHLQDVRPAQLPAGSGWDAAGVVDEVGESVDDVVVGDRVFGWGEATYAERAVLSAWAVMPDGLAFEEAAGYPVSVETATRLLRLVGVRAGQTLLVSGASGGVGSAVLQFARDRGVTVVATAGTDNQDYLRSMGATPTTYGPGLVDRVRQLTPKGLDAALDLAGSGVLPDLVELTGDPAKVVSIADFTAPQYGAQISSEPEDPFAAFAEAVRLFTEGAFHLPVEEAFPLERAADAQTRSAGGHARGRLVLTVS